MEYSKRPVKCVDLETYLIEDKFERAPKIVSAQFGERGDSEGRIELREDAAFEVLDMLQSDDWLITNHNLSYDLRCIMLEWPQLVPDVLRQAKARQLMCTLVLERLALIEDGILQDGFSTIKCSLSASAERRVIDSEAMLASKNDNAHWRWRYSELDGTPVDQWPRDAKKYAANDPILTIALWDAQILDTTERQHQVAAKFTARSVSLQMARLRGVKVDPLEVELVQAGLCAELDDATEAMAKEGLMRWNTKENRYSKVVKALRQRVKDAYRGDPPQTVPSKGRTSDKPHVPQPRTDKVTLLRSGDRVLQEFQRAQQLSSWVSTWVEPLQLGAEYTLCPDYGVPLASGRAWSSKPNILGIPRLGGFRECFVPREGLLFVYADYGQMELVALAQILIDLFSDYTLADRINSGEDQHIAVAEMYLGRPYNPETDALYRQAAKAANYGLPGCMGAGALRESLAKQQIYLTGAEVDGIVTACRARAPYLRRYHDHCRDLVRDGAPIEIPRSGGRRRTTDRVSSAANTYFQGLSAECALDAWEDFTLLCYCEELTGKAWPLIFMHDEIVAEAAEYDAHYVLAELRNVMLSKARHYFPDVCMTVEGCVGLRWSKTSQYEVQDAAVEDL